MTDERLIEEARVAFTEAWEAEERRIENWDRDARGNHSRSRAGVIAALAVFEESRTPTGDEREAQRIAHLDARQAAYRKECEDWYVDHEAEPEIASNAFFRGWDAAVDGGFRRSEVPEPSAEGYAEFEDWEQEMFRHQPVLSMADGSIAGCQCLDRVFAKGEDWGTHLAIVITSRITAEPQGEPSDAHLSNVSINGVRQTWQQLYEREHEAHLTLQGYRTMLSDLDRNASGRHEGDYDTKANGNGGISAGNPHLTTGQIIGYDIGGREYVVPEPRDRGTLSAWARAAGGAK